MRKRNPEALQDILVSILLSAARLGRKEAALFRSEMRHAVKGIFFALVLTVIGLMVAFMATAFLGVAIFEWLAQVMASRALAALILGGAAAVLAILIIVISYRRLVRTSFIPRRTMASLREDMRTLFGGSDDD